MVESLSELSKSESLILITGITGFLGSQCCALCLEQGYKVRGTVRSKQNTAKLQFIDSLPNKENLSIVEADLEKEETWAPAIEGCDFIMHVASPFPAKNPKHEDLLIKPAVQGTLCVLKAAASAQRKVKHVVITSSVAAIVTIGKGKKIVYDENDWPVVKNLPAYPKSKTLAERAAWDFYNQLPKESRFRLSTVNPGYILGPSLVSTDFTSAYLIVQLMINKVPGIPKIIFPIVDVRDVAQAHLAALEKGEIADGKRYPCTTGEMWFCDIADTLRKEFAKFGYKITKKKLYYCTAKFVSFFNKEVKGIMPFWNQPYTVKNDKAIVELGVRFNTKEDAVLQMAYSLIQHGVVPDKRK
jgi:dihydroflavonol-4-reductase